jgi:DnaK suppressor protein
MDREHLNYFEKLLTQWLEDLLRHADETVVDLMQSDKFTDLLDRASFDSERSFQLRIRDRESVLIKKIKNSLYDIQNGDYGICINCGEDISLKRLVARPVARHCISCKKEMENREKLTGTS